MKVSIFTMGVWHVIVLLGVTGLMCGVAALAAEGDSSCGTTPIPPKLTGPYVKIVGGTAAIKGSWPWQVQLKYGTHHYCGGTLISHQWLLTAAHCLVNADGDVDISFLTARLGSFLKDHEDDTEQIYRVVEKHVHPSYSILGQDFDIALLRLERAVMINDYVQPACLPSGDQPPAAGTTCYVTGFGQTHETLFSDRLKQAAVPLLDEVTCKLMYPGAISQHMLCAGYLSGGHDTCQGDSGGPLVCQEPSSGTWSVLGVTSWGAGCAQPWATGVYTDVGSFAAWVQGHIGAAARNT